MSSTPCILAASFGQQSEIDALGQKITFWMQTSHFGMDHSQQCILLILCIKISILIKSSLLRAWHVDQGVYQGFSPFPNLHIQGFVQKYLS